MEKRPASIRLISTKRVCGPGSFGELDSIAISATPASPVVLEAAIGAPPPELREGCEAVLSLAFSTCEGRGPDLAGKFALVIPGVGHHFAGFFGGRVQTFLRADITQDDGLQVWVEDIGEGDPLGDQRRCFEVFANLDAGSVLNSVEIHTSRYGLSTRATVAVKPALE